MGNSNNIVDSSEGSHTRHERQARKKCRQEIGWLCKNKMATRNNIKNAVTAGPAAATSAARWSREMVSAVSLSQLASACQKF